MLKLPTKHFGETWDTMAECSFYKNVILGNSSEITAHNRRADDMEDLVVEDEFCEGHADEQLAAQNEKQENGEDDDDEDALSLEEIRKLIVKIPGCTEVSAEDVGEWMVCDTSDPGFQILNDDEIVVSVREDVEVEVEEELSADVEVDGGPSASEAFAGLETALKWMERQPECDHLQLLAVKQMRDLASRKRLKTAKQLTLTEMFKKQ
nr:unnamed protein product [Callosobruchus chinensis]